VDVLQFGEADLSTPGVAATFTIFNRSPRPVRFEWPALGVVAVPGSPHAAVVFTPRCGHLPAGGRCAVTAVFRPDHAGAPPAALAAVRLDAAGLAATLFDTAVTYARPAAEAATAARAAARAAAAAGGGPPAKLKPPKGGRDAAGPGAHSPKPEASHGGGKGSKPSAAAAGGSGGGKPPAGRLPPGGHGPAAAASPARSRRPATAPPVAEARVEWTAATPAPAALLAAGGAGCRRPAGRLGRGAGRAGRGRGRA
jgi:hypothetical protein